MSQRSQLSLKLLDFLILEGDKLLILADLQLPRLQMISSNQEMRDLPLELATLLPVFAPLLFQGLNAVPESANLGSFEVTTTVNH